MATEELGIRITAEGVFETASGLKLTREAIQEVATQLRTATKEGGAFARSQDASAEAAQGLTTRTLAAASAIGTVLGNAVVDAGRRFLAKTQAVVASTAALGTLSARTSFAVERLAALEYAAEQSDTTVGTLTTSLTRLNRVMLEAQRDAGSESARSLGALGIDPQALQSSEDALLKIADAFRRIDDPEFKSAMAQRLRLSQELIPLLNEGAAGIRRLTDEGAKYHRVTADQANAAKEFSDQLAALQAQTSSWFRDIATSVLPTLSRWIEQLREGTEIAGGFASALALLGTQNPFRAPGESLRSLRGELDELTKARERYTRSNADTSAIDQAIAALRKRIEFAKLLERQAAAQNRADYSNEGHGRERTDAPDLAALKKTTKDRSLKAPTERDEFGSVLEEIRRQAQAVEQLTFVEKVAADIESGRYKTLTTNQKTVLINAAQEVSTRQMAAEVAKAQAEGEAKRAEAARKRMEEEQQHWTALSEAAAEYQVQQRAEVENWRDMIQPARQYVREIEKIGVAVQQGRLTFDEGGAAVAALQTRAAEVNKQGSKDFRELQQAVEGFGRRATSAFVDWASGAKTSLREVAATAAKEFASMLLYKQVFGPLFNAAGSFMGSDKFWKAGGGGVKFADLPVAAPSARGNVFGPSGIVPFGRGGLVTGPTFFPFAKGGVGVMGEAGTEAIMPLKRTADGRLGVAAMPAGGGSAPAAAPVAPNVNVTVVADARSDISTLRALTLQAVRGALSEQQRLARIGAG